MANTFGTIALIYSAIGVGLSFAQNKNDDLNTLLAAVSTGALYGAISRSKVQNLSSSMFLLKLFILFILLFLFPDQSLLLHTQLKRAAFGSLIGVAIACSYTLCFNYDKYFSE